MVCPRYLMPLIIINLCHEYLKNIRDLLSIKVKKNNYSNYAEYYDNESNEFVGELYKKDIEILNITLKDISDF